MLSLQGSLSLQSDLIEANEENSNSEMDIIKVQAHKNVLVTDDKVRITEQFCRI